MPLVHQDYMLDTNVFNDALDGKISMAAFASRRLLVTGIQAAELRATKNSTRQRALLVTFEKVKATVLYHLRLITSGRRSWATSESRFGF